MMKDKLYKYNHKALYYITRKAVTCMLAFIGLSVAVAVPTTINLLTTAPSKGLAEGNSSMVEPVEEVSSESELSFE